MSNSRTLLPLTLWSASSLWAIELKPLSMLFFSQAMLGVGDGLIVLSQLGSTPWTVLSQGLALQWEMSIGWASFLVSCTVMLGWIPLRLKVGLGTVLNIIVIAFFLGLTVAFLPQPTALLLRCLYLIFGIVLFGVGSALYLTCHQGAGPRDGLMVGICQHWGLKVGLVRTFMEATVCTFGFLLGGTVGVGTLAFALSIGWVIQLTLRYLFNSPLLLHKGNRSA